jgi:drug/metabolite transporter (DMT)-like permease
MPQIAIGNRTQKLKIIGVVLIVAGVAALIYGGFSYTTRKKAVDLGPVQIDRVQHHSVPLPPVLGVIAIAGGSALLYFGGKQRL